MRVDMLPQWLMMIALLSSLALSLSAVVAHTSTASLLLCCPMPSKWIRLCVSLVLYMQTSSSYFRQTPWDSSGELVTRSVQMHAWLKFLKQVFFVGQTLITKKKINVFKAFCYRHTEKHRDMGNFKKLTFCSKIYFLLTIFFKLSLHF